MRELGFTMDPSCRLYLPLYRAEVVNGKVMDESPWGVHPSVVGATRSGAIEYLRGPKEYVVNGYFDGNINGWTNVGVDSFSYDNAGSVTLNESTPPAYIYQDMSLVPGEDYLFQYGLGAGTGTLELVNNGITIVSDSGTYVYKLVPFRATGSDTRITLTVTGTSKSFGGLGIKPLIGYAKPKAFYFDGIDDQILGSVLNSGVYGNLQSAMTSFVWARKG